MVSGYDMMRGIMAVGTVTKVNKGGRPMLFKTAEALQYRIDEYFDFCDNRIQHVYSKKRDEVIEIINPCPYTMSGLAYYLGVDRDTLLNYKKRDGFFGTVKKARDRVAMDVEQRLMEGAGVGAIFNLKNNFGWVDQTLVDNKHEIVQPILGGATKKSVEELDALYPDDGDTQVTAAPEED